MIIKHIRDIKNTALDVDWGYGNSLRLLTSADGMGFTLTDTYIESNSEFDLKYDHHVEACYILEGAGEIHFDDSVETLSPGTLYGLNKHDCHTIKSFSATRMICVFVPALSGHEIHDFSTTGASGYSAAMDLGRASVGLAGATIHYLTSVLGIGLIISPALSVHLGGIDAILTWLILVLSAFHFR